MSRRKTFEERIAERDARRGPLKEGAVFEHGPAKFIFITLLVLVVIGHVIALVVMMAMGVH
jgi:hypothetical protein